MKPLADPAAERRTKSQARRGLAIYFALLIPLSAVFETLMIVSDVSWAWVLMWVNPRTGDDVAGWVRTERLKETGTIGPNQ
jgi:hypothetical protein